MVWLMEKQKREKECRDEDEDEGEDEDDEIDEWREKMGKRWTGKWEAAETTFILPPLKPEISTRNDPFIKFCFFYFY